MRFKTSKLSPTTLSDQCLKLSFPPKSLITICSMQLEELQNVPEKSKKELQQLEEKKTDLEVWY